MPLQQPGHVHHHQPHQHGYAAPGSTSHGMASEGILPVQPGTPQTRHRSVPIGALDHPEVFSGLHYHHPGSSPPSNLHRRHSDDPFTYSLHGASGAPSASLGANSSPVEPPSLFSGGPRQPSGGFDSVFPQGNSDNFAGLGQPAGSLGSQSGLPAEPPMASNMLGPSLWGDDKHSSSLLQDLIRDDSKRSETTQVTGLLNGWADSTSKPSSGGGSIW